MEFKKTKLDGVIKIVPDRFGDDRGYFMETYHQTRYQDGGVDVTFRQDNHSFSEKGVLRGLHYQLTQPQAKLIYVVQGEIFDVAVDIREGSPTFGQWVGEYLSSQNGHQLFVPAGFAHGFCVTSDTVAVIYKCSDFYNSEDEYGVIWNDPVIGIQWPVENPTLSLKDAKYVGLDDKPKSEFPKLK